MAVYPEDGMGQGQESESCLLDLWTAHRLFACAFKRG